ncbi:MAG: dockerin type I repeat-containing protein [Clostridia bacterium]|nr:dockerin type I repeat-containing protein [Clostridia bacterium]
MKRNLTRPLSIILSILFILSCGTGLIAFAYAIGDVDGSGKVDSTDARLALRAAAKLDTLTSEQFTAADVDSNGKVDSVDARMILRVAARLDTFPDSPTQPVQQPTSAPGYWSLNSTKVQKPNNTLEGNIENRYTIAPGDHHRTVTKHGPGYWVDFIGSCTAPPEIVRAGERVTLEISLKIKKSHDEPFGEEITETARVRLDKPELWLAPTQEAVAFTAADGTSAIRVTNDTDKSSASASIGCAFPQGSQGQTIAVYFMASGEETVWTYVWTSGSPSTAPTSPSSPPAPSGETTRTKVTGTELQKYQSKNPTLEISELYRYKKGGKEHVTLDDYETVEFDISNIPADERQSYLGLYLDDETGEPFWIVPDPEAKLNGKLRFETLHYSLFGYGKPTENDLIVAWANKAAAQGVTQRISEEEITPGLKDMVADALNAGGLGKDQYGGAIVRFILSHNTKGEILTAMVDGDMDEVKKIVVNNTAEFIIGKILTGEDDSVLYGGIGDDVSAVRKAVRDGDYATATLEIVKNIEKNMFPAVNYGQKFAGLVDKLADIWTDEMMNEQYASFERMMTNEGRVTADDWNVIYYQLHGAMNRLSQRGVGSAELRKKFEQRYANNEKIKKESTELIKLVARWRSTGLLNDLYWFGHPSEIEMLNSLRQQREMIKEMLTIDGKFKRGKNYNSDEVFLNDALFYWVTNSKANRAGFYDWLRSEGILAPIKDVADEALERFYGKWSAVVHKETEGYVDYSSGVIYDGASSDTRFIAEIKLNGAGQTMVTRTIRDASETSGGEYSVTLTEGTYSISGKTLTVYDQSGNGLAYWLRLTLISDTQMDMDEMYLDGTSDVVTLTKE